jgi:hypothetical protein
MKFPTVIWMGKAVFKKNTRRFRVVYRGPTREKMENHDTPFICEQRIGQSMMKRLNWDAPRPGAADGPTAYAMQECIWALSHAFGQILMAYPESLVQGHPIHCELNMSAIEGRESRGCDCDGPDEPEEHPED